MQVCQQVIPLDAVPRVCDPTMSLGLLSVQQSQISVISAPNPPQRDSAIEDTCGGCLIAITTYQLPIGSLKRNFALVLPITNVLKDGHQERPPLPPGTEQPRYRCRMGTVIKTIFISERRCANQGISVSWDNEPLYIGRGLDKLTVCTEYPVFFFLLLHSWADFQCETDSYKISTRFLRFCINLKATLKYRLTRAPCAARLNPSWI